MTILRPQDFGATDNTGERDESEALQDAIDAVSGTRHILDLDGGNWRYRRQLIMQGTVRIRNGQLSYAGPDNTVSIVARPKPETEAPGIGPLESNMVKKSPKEKATLIMQDVCIHHVQCKNQVGMQIENGFRVSLQRVNFTNWRNGGTALRLEGVQLGRFEDCMIEDCYTSMVITGLHLGPPSTALTFTHCQFRSHFASGSSVLLLPYNPDAVVAGSWDNNKQKASGARKCVFEYCYFEEGRHGGYIEAHSTRFMTLFNCYFEDPADGFSSLELLDEIGESLSNKVMYCTFSNTHGSNQPAHIRIGPNVRRTLLIGNSHAIGSVAVDDNGSGTTILQQN